MTNSTGKVKKIEKKDTSKKKREKTQYNENEKKGQ